ncbi:SLBB domain-containing protein [Larkinella bovis]|uniref:SLBB domain-containing protein n=1 Tax=Larkinella bovis TaxID=683041 RepID=A0ABW0I9A5_9BACT
MTRPMRAQKVSDLTDDQVRQFVQQAKSSGLSEAQIEQLAVSRGFTSDDMAKMRQRITALENPAAVNATPPPVNREQADQGKIDAAPAPHTGHTGLPVFGVSLFSSTNLTFEPNLRIPTPKNYQIGPEDELIIDVYGNAQQNYRVKVSPEGAIKLENLSPIYVNGLTIEQAEQRIVSRLRQLYAGLNSAASGVFATITLGSIRSIKVTLIGQVVKPGTYTLSSLSTVFNALYVSGGPDPDRGSFRDIRVYRGNRLIRSLDIYDFLLRADQKDNIRLQDQDIVFVNHYDTRIELTGEVKQPAVYEVRKGELLKNVLAFAGGFTDKAYTASLTLRRNTPKELQIVTVPADEIPVFVPQRGDQYSVGAIIDRYENRVMISGAVFRPGAYALQKSPTLRQLIQTAEGLREDAFLNRAIIRRLRDNLDPEIIAVDLGKLMRGEAGDMVLQREDVVTVSSYSELREHRRVSIQGAVNRPGTFDYVDSLSVADLVMLAGGFSDGATATRIEIARRIRKDTTGLLPSQNVRLFQFNVSDDLKRRETDARFVLQPFDQVFVRTSSRYETQKLVTITGEVPYPGVYPIRDKSERITELIARAGGLRPEAYLKATRFVRKGELISVDLREVMVKASDSGNLLLLQGDSIHIPRKTELVKIRGEVLNPAIVDYNRSKSIKDYVSESGGFTAKAQRRKVYVIYANGKVNKTKGFLGFRSYPESEPGMELVIPAKPPKSESKLSPAERVAVMTGISSLAAVVLTLVRLWQ